MAGPPTAAFSQITLRYGGSALPFGAVTTHGFTTPTGDLNDILDGIANFADEMRQALTNDVEIEDALWKVGPVATGQTIILPLGLTGGQGAPAAPPNVATLVRLSALDISGRFAGRFYLPGVNEAGVSANGLLSGGQLDLVQASVLAAYAAIGLVGAEPRVFSSVSSDPRIVESIQTQQRVGSQRKRNRR